MSDTPTLLNSFHNFTSPELTGTETQINLDEEQKNLQEAPEDRSAMEGDGARR